jgi:hypothetical protein
VIFSTKQHRRKIQAFEDGISKAIAAKHRSKISKIKPWARRFGVPYGRLYAGIHGRKNIGRVDNKTLDPVQEEHLAGLNY